ncbi:MAG: peptide chain release factor 2 [Fimbriimonas ginsengisoli]|uniref:Peptide chain release factor 2 n=1 Tax=Fimbriimonas ginsengisoli TaxID=1005039 RepID=A0A931LTU1_FIMGI|nr:peptide chain release factor 2 [Fimbriimonas ginsengisoli]
MLSLERHEALSTARGRLDAIGGHLDLDRLRAQIAELETQSAQTDFWSDPSAANKTQQRLSRLRAIATPFLDLRKTERDLAELYEMLAGDPSPELEKEADQMAAKFLDDLDAYELRTLLSGEHDARNALVEINAGAGGSEACDWASILLRMVTRWGERHGYKVEILSETPGDVAGYRSVDLLITGEYAYGYLKAENGVHRLVRISPFDAAARRHTSFARIEVLPETEETEVKIDPDDLKVETLRAGGAGGQHVNKTESAVRITHLPSGLVVTCQNERSQHKNRASAMTVLAARLGELERRKDAAALKDLKGDTSPAEWGGQIRSYVMQPYTMVKDHRTGHETGNVVGVLDGDLDGFIEAFLKRPPAEGTFIE